MTHNLKTIDINENEKLKLINDKLSILTVFEKLQKLGLDNVMMDFEATSLYLYAMWDGKSVYPKIESVFAFKPCMHNMC